MSDVAQEMLALNVSGGPPTARAAGALAVGDAGRLSASAQLRDAMHDVAIQCSDSAREPYVMIYLCEDKNKTEFNGPFLGTTCIGKLCAQWDLRNFCQANRLALTKHYKDMGHTDKRPLVQKFKDGGELKSYDLSGRLPEIFRHMLYEVALSAKKVTNCFEIKPEYEFFVYDDDWSKETSTDNVKYLFRRALCTEDQEESEDDSGVDPITAAELAYEKEHHPVCFLPKHSWQFSSQKKQRNA